MDRKPDILIFNPDQWRGDVLGHVGNPAVQTPVLDGLVQTHAVSFASTFCQNPVCTPSRCSFMTGWYPHVRGHRTMHHMLHPERDEPNLLQILKQQGYFIWWGGKNDLVPAQHGFEDHCDVHFRATRDDYRRWGLTPRENRHGGDLSWRGPPEEDQYYSFFRGRLDPGEEELYCDGDWAMVLGAMDFLQSYTGDQPLCIYLPLGHPHPPYGIEDPWFDLTERGALPRRPRAPDRWEGKPCILSGIAEGQGLGDWDEGRWTELRATYYGMCARADYQLGRILEVLKETRRYDNTAVFFFSDHGDFTGDYGLVEKTQNTFEDCLSRVPMVIKPPRAYPVMPRVCTDLVELIDFPATVYDLLGIDPGYDHFGRSLMPLLSGQAGGHRDAVFCEGGRRLGETQAMERESVYEASLYWPRLRCQISDAHPWHGKATMCRTHTRKYVMRLYEQDELYDLESDPEERINRINDPAYTADVRDLRQRLLKWYMETCDAVPHVPDQR